MAMRLFAEDREILAKAFPIHRGVSTLVHPIICSAHGNALLYLNTSEVFVVTAARRRAVVLNAVAKLLRLCRPILLRPQRLLEPSSSEEPIHLCRHVRLPL